MSPPSRGDVVDVPVQKTDRVPSTENGPKAVGDDATAKVRKSGDGRSRVFARTE